MRTVIVLAVIAFMSNAAVAQTVGDYILVLTAPMTVVNADNSTTVLPIGTVVNRILWDGVTPYTPPSGEEIQPANGHQIGDVVTP